MPVRLGAVSYLNTLPLVWGLERSPSFDVRFDVPSRCAALLHAGSIDVGLIPVIEYLRGSDYRVVPGPALASRGAVASVALFTPRAIADVRSVAVDTSSRTSAALVRVLCKRLFRIAPVYEAVDPDPDLMLSRCDAALIIGDNALFLDHSSSGIEKIDLGEAWFRMTGLPFVYAFWAGREGAINQDEVRLLQRARDEGVMCTAEIARRYSGGDERRRAIAEPYLRQNMKYDLGEDERAGVEAFYAYAAETEAGPSPQPLRFF
jgi:chorismate dehydratase